MPLYEAIINSIISLLKADIPKDKREIQIKIIRGEAPSNLNFENVNTIHSIIVTDNGLGFNEENYKAFETPFTRINKKYGCKGIGRFTVLAAFKKIKVRSNYQENNVWKYREFECDAENEVTPIYRYENRLFIEGQRVVFL